MLGSALDSRSGSGDQNSKQNLIVSKNDGASIMYEFRIKGLTCVACSSAIERGMELEFKNRGLVLDE